MKKLLIATATLCVLAALPAQADIIIRSNVYAGPQPLYYPAYYYAPQPVYVVSYPVYQPRPRYYNVRWQDNHRSWRDERYDYGHSYGHGQGNPHHR